MTKRTLWDPNLGDVPANLAFTNNFAATTNPGTGDDSADGYSVGSVWVNVTLDIAYICTDATEGAAVWSPINEGGSAPGVIQAPDATSATGAGGDASITGGDGGATSGAGGKSGVYGGAAAGGNSNGGAVEQIGGAGHGTGRQGVVIDRGYTYLRKFAAPAALTTSATLTAAQILGGMLTANQGAAGAASYQLPLATDLDTALPEAAVGDCFDFSLTNVSTVAAEDATVTTNTGWTLFGNMVVASNAAATDLSAGTFRARKTAAGAWSLYRVA